MADFEAVLGLLLVAVVLAAVARRLGAPYPAFLALGGAVLAFVPGTPALSVPPDLALALFVAPVLLDAAYDTSPRDLKDQWVPVASLVVVSVALTTVAVAAVARALVPAMPWAAAIALGAIVSPPDAAAATAVLRQLRPPHRILTILEGESLLNDASALQVRPILSGLEPATRALYLQVAGAVVLTVIVVRIAWVMTHNALARWRIHRVGFHPPRPTQRPTVRGGLVISWAGMRGIVTLAAALALPTYTTGGPFPFR